MKRIAIPVPLDLVQGPQGLLPRHSMEVDGKKPEALSSVLVHQTVHFLEDFYFFHDGTESVLFAGEEDLPLLGAR